MRRIGKYLKAPGNHGEARLSYRAARVVDDAISFHGAKLIVKVHHAYPSRLFGRKVNIAAGRYVVLGESGIEISVDDRMVTVRLSPPPRRRKGKSSPPPFGAFADELPKRQLRRFPILYSYRRNGRLDGITIFR